MNKLYDILLGRKRLKLLASNGLYIAVCRGLTFTWFAFTLAWFWSNWTQLAGLAKAMGAWASICSLALVLIAATLGLALWEAARSALLRIEWGGQSVLCSRYTRTAWCTALVLISIATALLIRQQAPEIVYKTF
jgi:hypothetical protein